MTTRKSAVALAGLVGCLLLVPFSTTSADEIDSGFYIGGSGGVAAIETTAGTSNIDGDDTGWKIIAGWRIFNFLGVEASWVDLGATEETVSGTDFEVAADGLDLFGVGAIPIGKSFELFGKVGMIAWDAELDSSNPSLDASDDGEDFAWGAGAAFRFARSWAIRAEYEEFDLDGTENVNLISAGVTFTF